MQLPHPAYIVAPEKRDDLQMLEPIYPLTAGLSGKVLAKACRAALDKLPELEEWQDAAWLAARQWAGQQKAASGLHRPQDAGEVVKATPGEAVKMVL